MLCFCSTVDTGAEQCIAKPHLPDVQAMASFGRSFSCTDAMLHTSISEVHQVLAILLL